MSWDKNTVIRSEIDTVIKTLEVLGIEYTLSLLGEVVGNGGNDHYSENNEPKMYPIRKLEYSNVVLLEQMLRTTDCDVDDLILSYDFKKNELPSDWDLEETIDLNMLTKEK